MSEIRMLSTSGILGYGYAEESLRIGMGWQPHAIGCDGGSTDPGPHYLGAGTSFCSRLSVKRDLRLMLLAAIAAKIPCIIGTAGGAGGEPHLQDTATLVREIAAEENLSFRMALIHAEPDRAILHQAVTAGLIKPLAKLAPLDAGMIDRAERIVAMMGPEPIARALDGGAQVILCGRSSDPAQWAAVALRGGIPPEIAWYAGKMLECGAAPATPKGPDCLYVTVREDGVVCEPMGDRACTPLSVANHSLHENSSPIRHVEPGGILDTSACRFEQVSPKATLVTGMRWEPAETYTIKLEAAEKVGHRAVTICGTRDPLLIGQLDGFLDIVRELVRSKAADLDIAPAQYRLTIHTYGRDGVMGAREPVQGTNGAHELGFLVDVVADSPDTSAAVIALARTSMLHADFPGRLCREGNMAIPFSPSDLTAGEVYRFSMNHVVLPDDPYEMFPIEFETV